MALPRPPWKNPRWNSIKDADLRAVLFDLQEFLKRPSFPNGIELGDGSDPTVSGDVVVAPPTTPVDSTTLDDIVAGLPPDDGVAPAAPVGQYGPNPAADSPGPYLARVFWAANTEPDMVNGYGSYDITTDLSLDGGSTWIPDVGTASNVAGTSMVFGLPTGLTFRWRVRAVDAHGHAGSWSGNTNALAVTQVQTIHIEPLAIDETLIAPDSIATPMLQAEAVTANEIASRTILAENIAANEITAYEIAGHTITAAEIVAGTITANEIAAHTLTADELATEVVLASQEIRTGSDPDPRVVISDSNTGAGIALHPGASASVYPAELYAREADTDQYVASLTAPQPNPLPAEIPGELSFQVDTALEESFATLRSDRILLKGATPGCLLSKSSSVTAAAHNTWTKMAFSSSDVVAADEFAMWNDANDRFVIPYDGIWLITLHVEWPAAADGLRAMSTYRNGTTRREFDAQYYASSGLVRLSRTSALELSLDAGDTLEFHLLQTSGGGSLTPDNVRFSARMVSGKNIVWV